MERPSPDMQNVGPKNRQSELMVPSKSTLGLAAQVAAKPDDQAEKNAPELLRDRTSGGHSPVKRP